MIPKDCKRLAELSRDAVREKSKRHGHPSTYHLWCASRLVAPSRSVLLGDFTLAEPWSKLQQPMYDPARPDWNDVTKIAHYALSVNAMMMTT